MWLVAEGKRVEYAEEVYSMNAAANGKKLKLLCPTSQIRSRGDTLNRPTLTVVGTKESFAICTWPTYHDRN